MQLCTLLTEYLKASVVEVGPVISDDLVMMSTSEEHYQLIYSQSPEHHSVIRFMEHSLMHSVSNIDD